jgi:hypothetical protein
MVEKVRPYGAYWWTGQKTNNRFAVVLAFITSFVKRDLCV